MRGHGQAAGAPESSASAAWSPPSTLSAEGTISRSSAACPAAASARRCPEDVGLLMFDDHPWAEFTAPPLSVVRQPTEEVGRLAAERVLGLIESGSGVRSTDRRTQTALRDDDAVAETECVALKTELVIRQSCAPHHGS